MKKFTIVLAAVALLASSIELSAQNQPVRRVQRRPCATRSGECCGVNACTIAAGIGILVAIAAVALISNNAHSH